MSEISVLMPIYNAEKNLKACLESIENQTFTDFEVIMVDDGSKDSSHEIAKEMASRDSRFIILSQENNGSGVARNTALDYFYLNSTSKYIAWADSDDILDENYLKILYDAIELTNSDIVQCKFDYISMNEGKIEKDNTKIKFLDNKTGYEMLEHLFNGKDGICYAVLWNKIFARKLFIDIRVNHNDQFTGRIGDDEDLLWRVYGNTDKVLFIDNSLYFYRITEGSQQHSKTSSRVLETFEIWVNRWKYCNDQKLFDLQSISENKIVFVIAMLSSKKECEYENYHEFKLELKKAFEEITKIVPFEMLRLDLNILVKLSKVFWSSFYLYGKCYRMLRNIKQVIIK